MKDWLDILFYAILFIVVAYILGRIITRAALKEIDKFLYKKFNNHSSKFKNNGTETKSK